MVFWAIVGSVSYILAIWVQMAFFAVKEEIKEADYVMPARYKKRYWSNIIITNSIVVGLSITWIVSIFVFFQLLLPKFSKLLNYSLDNGSAGKRIEDLVGSLLLTAACLYGLVMLSHLLRKSWHRFSA